MPVTEFITLMVSLVAMLNPLGNAAIFLAMTENRQQSEFKQIVWHCSLAVAIILIVVVWVGGALLHFFGISIGAFQVAGGLIVALIGLDMLRAKQHANTHHTEGDKNVVKKTDSIAVVPLAMPIIAGPGAIAAIIAQSNHMSGVVAKLEVSLGCAIIAVGMAIVLWFSPVVKKVIGEGGMRIATRVMGLVLAAIAFQMMGTGLKTLLPGLA